jgi:LmbE family N-acetylglucosaminyl deacetylase
MQPPSRDRRPEPKWVQPDQLLSGQTLMVVPHMDDELLGAGGTIALLANKKRFHVVYATDGMGSPEPLLPWRDKISDDLSEIRMNEARAALGYLGIGESQVTFLGLPDGQLRQNGRVLSQLLAKHIAVVDPDVILVPFRFDRHPDHLTLNRVVTSFAGEDHVRGKLVEYFVYHQWRMLPEGDIRKYIRPELIVRVDISEVARQKRAAFDFFRSQTSLFYHWQTRPNLTPEVLDANCQSPECFLVYDDAWSGNTIFERNTFWISLAHHLEPFLKKRKDKAKAFWSRRGNL